ncbi:hypothetical protein HELRODRAFT_179526 [Helobdella robusta]|uniref:Uncharacterized protein n=1 Tax=Helobdella robusta TaxID=6412 RepID=T1FEU5_HELRO|nr:hypothetical protein HELRODRAFT_179526 [Helobdella robusta]ESN95199.1 hypothetical protein HELRODRAFT_179526 [Helobdella robusta]
MKLVKCNKKSIIKEVLISTSFFLFFLSPSFSSSISSTYTKIPTAPSSTCYPDTSETTQYSVRSVQRCAAYCSILPTCRRFNYYYQSNVYGTAGDCRLFPSSNCQHVLQINGFLAYVNNATIPDKLSMTTVMVNGFDCALNNPCPNAIPTTDNPNTLFPDIDPAKFIQCSNGYCYIFSCPASTYFNDVLKLCT